MYVCIMGRACRRLGTRLGVPIRLGVSLRQAGTTTSTWSHLVTPDTPWQPRSHLVTPGHTTPACLHP